MYRSVKPRSSPSRTLGLERTVDLRKPGTRPNCAILCTLICIYCTAMASWRLELFFKSPQELQRQVPFLRSHGTNFQGVNLTNKSKDDDLLSSVRLLKREIPDLDVCVHYSLRHNYHTAARRSLLLRRPGTNTRLLHAPRQRIWSQETL